MTIEAGVVVTKLGCLWHLPPGRSGGYLPDSPDLWQQLWENRAILEGFAHSHPGKGRAACSPSLEDITTFDAIERALGKSLRWWICSADCMVEYRRSEGLLAAYIAVQNWEPAADFPHYCEPAPPIWLHILREISGHYVMMFQCIGCRAPCEFDSREPMLGWGCEGGSVCPGPWSENREFKTIAKSCVYCDPEDEYKRTGKLPAAPLKMRTFDYLTPEGERRELHAALDEIFTPAGIARKTSGYRNEECPVWDSVKGCWTESDEQLRARLTPRAT